MQGDACGSALVFMGYSLMRWQVLLAPSDLVSGMVRGAASCTKRFAVLCAAATVCVVCRVPVLLGGVVWPRVCGHNDA